MKKSILILAALLLTPALAAFGQARPNGDKWKASVIDIEITGKSYDYIQPWSKSTRTLRKIGTVVGEREILTTALGLNDNILIRLRLR